MQIRSQGGSRGSGTPPLAEKLQLLPITNYIPESSKRAQITITISIFPYTSSQHTASHPNNPITRAQSTIKKANAASIPAAAAS